MGQCISLYHAFCEFAYAIGKTDRQLLAGDKNKLRKILEAEFINCQDMVSHVLNKDCMDIHIAHLWVAKEMATSKLELNEENKARFSRVIKNVLDTFPGMTTRGKSAAEHFLTELSLY